ncbi:MAG: HU family DNA-binding protein [Desulfovibrio sp.]|nr:HU family DNA-binding protein [Desulfovibrio sp.]
MPGLSKLSVKSRPARKGRNPRIPACRTAKFAPAKALKDALN